MRARQRNRSKPKEAFRADPMKWHSTVQKQLVRMGAGWAYDAKWSCFLLFKRLKVDQSPVPFFVDSKKTYEIIRPGDKHKKAWINRQALGWERRQCTLQVWTRADVKQQRIAVIFCGKGKRVRPDKKIAWHPDVDVLWRENAWADTIVSINWVNTTLKPVVENLEKYVLFVDDLTAQQTDDFKKADLKGVVWYELKNASDLCQVVDAGIAQTLKVLTRRNYRKWLDKE